MSTTLEFTEGSIAVIQLNHESRHNPFSEQLEDDIKRALHQCQEDPAIEAVVVTGGPERSFSSGGDFNEVQKLSGGDEVDRWIDRVTQLYVSVLKVDKPTVAAIDGYAIGMGFQFAMMFDWRVMAQTAEFRMPELKHGLGCSVGAAILSSICNFNTAREIIFDCESIDAERAMHYGLANQVVPPSELMTHAMAQAARLASYPQVPYRSTKRAMLKDLMEKLYTTSEESKQVHRAAFASRAAQAHFRNILGADKYGANPVGKQS